MIRRSLLTLAAASLVLAACGKGAAKKANADAPLIPGSTTVRASGGLNVLDLPGGPGCGAIPGQAPYDALLWDVPSAGLACAWDTGRAAVLQQCGTTVGQLGVGGVRACWRS